MPRLMRRRALLHVTAMICCVAGLVGCASWQGPRIDPTGERLLIWPNQTPPVGAPIVTPAPGAPVLTPPPAGSPAPFVAPPPVIAPFGNVQAPPVYSDPPGLTVTPAPAPGSFPTPVAPAPGAAPVITTPAPPPTTSVAPVAPLPLTPVVPAGATNFATPLGTLAPAGAEYIRVAPAGILVPVGSEVVLKAGVCRPDGQLVANQRVQWSLDRSGVGQFAESREREPLYSLARWAGPQMYDPWNATSPPVQVPGRLTRGTPEPTDDVQLLRGDAWIGVTSLTEGTSRVTAYAPGLANYNQATATIHWLDAQWVYPPSATVEPSRPHVLTTTVTRRTNSAPIAGWLVRYDAAPGTSLGYEGGNMVEVPTDANGRASVEISPVSAGGGASTVGVTIIRPLQAGPNATPRLEIGRGSATITWGAGGAPGLPVSPPPTSAPAPPTTSPASPYTPSPFTPSPPPATQPTTPSEPPPSLPRESRPAEPYTPPADQPPPGRAELELQLRRTGPEQVGVGEFASFEVTITNRGSGTARGIRLQDRFDTGLRHPSAKPGEYSVEYPGVRDLPPGESTSIPLTFQVVAGGTQCHEVTVTAEGVAPLSERGCVSAQQAAVEVEVRAPRTRVAGEVAQFSVIVKNTGEVAATNVEIENRYDAALDPNQAPEGHERLADGSILLRIDRLVPGERRTFATTAICRAAANRACNRAIVTADGGITAAAEGCVEILPTLDNGPGDAQAAMLRLTVTENKNPTRVNERQIIYINLENSGGQTQRQVSLRVLLPQELSADTTQIQPQQGLQVQGQELQFTVNELPAQQQLRFTIPVTANRAGSTQVRAAAIAAGMANYVTADSNLIEILPTSL